MNLSELKETIAKASDGPWMAVQSNVRLSQEGANKPIFDNGRWVIVPEQDYERPPLAEVDYGDDHCQLTREKSEYEAKFIAASRTALPHALQVMEEMAGVACAINAMPCHMEMTDEEIGKAINDLSLQALTAYERFQADVMGEK